MIFLKQEYLFLAEYLKNTKSQFPSNTHNIGDALGEDLRSLSESEADEEADLIGKNLIFVSRLFCFCLLIQFFDSFLFN